MSVPSILRDSVTHNITSDTKQASRLNIMLCAWRLLSSSNKIAFGHGNTPRCSSQNNRARFATLRDKECHPIHDLGEVAAKFREY
jgi:hypothetical protein